MGSFLFRKKTVGEVRKTDATDGLPKVLGVWDLVAIGIGTIMGSGIFVFTGIEAAQHAGPAVIVSLAIAAVAALFIALVYTEVASAIPSSGGSYTYTYTSFGEVPGFLVGWMYLLFCICAIPAIAQGWSGYFVGILKQLHINLPDAIISSTEGFINLPAVFICLLMTSVLIRGVKESTTLNMILVFVKILAALLFVIIAVPDFKMENWSNFMPYGFEGVALSAGVLFFAYNGFDAVANAAEECKNPTRDITIGLIGSLIVCAVIYMGIGAMLTGIVPFTQLNTPEALAYALRANGSNIGGAIVAVGGIAGMTTVVLFQLYSQTRILMAMSRDGFFPLVFAKLHERYRTPYVGTICCGLLAAFIAGFFPTSILASVSSLLILSMLGVVVAAAMWLRKTKPTLHRPFRCPMISVIGTFAMLCCIGLISGLLASVGVLAVVLLSIGLVWYFLYSKPRLDKQFAVSSKRR